MQVRDVISVTMVTSSSDRAAADVEVLALKINVISSDVKADERAGGGDWKSDRSTNNISETSAIG